MKHTITIFLLGIWVSGFAQVDKTQLSLNITNKYMQNIGILQGYTWTRNVQVLMKNEVKATIQFSCYFGSDGKLVSQEISKESSTKEKPGIRGAVQSNQQDDTKEYATNAMNLVLTYIFMTKGQMVDLFDKGNISEINNTIQAEGFNQLVQGDHILFTYDSKSLEATTQTISTLMNSDPVQCKVVYQMQASGLNTVESMTLTLPAKNLQVVATNTNYAKKL